MKSPSLSSPVEEKIAWAEECYNAFGERFLEDRALRDLLSRLESAVKISREAMLNAGILEICRACEEDEGGSCCGAGLENRYDGWLLLINLLMGVKLPGSRYDPRSCYFLGRHGCLLQARHVICVNYVCPKITQAVDPRKMKSLREKEGDELAALFLLHERVKKIGKE